MKYDVTFTEQAENDLRGIFEYIAFDLLSPENAAGQLGRIEEKILSLGEYPEKFRQYEREPWKSRNTREIHELCLLIIMLFSISPIRQRNWLQ